MSQFHCSFFERPFCIPSSTVRHMGMQNGLHQSTSMIYQVQLVSSSFPHALCLWQCFFCRRCLTSFYYYYYFNGAKQECCHQKPLLKSSCVCVCVCHVSLPLSACRQSSSVSPFTLSCVLSARDSLRLCPSVCVYVSVSRSSVTNKGFNGVLGSLAFPFSEATWPAITTLMIVFQSIPFHPIPSRCLFHLSLVVIVWVPSHSILLHHQNHLM